MTFPKVRIEATAGGIGTKVFIDGVEQQNLTAIDLHVGVRGPSELTLTSIAVEPVVEGEMHVRYVRQCAACRHEIPAAPADVTAMSDEVQRFSPIEPA